MSYLFRNPFPSQAQIDAHYNIGGWAEISKNRDDNTSGRNKIPSGADRINYIHRYLNHELNLPPGAHSHDIDSMSGPTNKVKNGEVTISPIDKAINFNNIT